MSQAEHANFAQQAFAYARHHIKQAVFVTNPGVPCAPEYLAGHDAPAACMFEHHAGFEQFQPPDWLVAKGSQHLAVLVYQVKSADEMRKALQLALQVLPFADPQVVQELGAAQPAEGRGG